MATLQKIVGILWVSSIMALPILGIGFNIVYLYVHFGRQVDWWWNSGVARVSFIIFITDIVISIITHLFNKLFLKMEINARRTLRDGNSQLKPSTQTTLDTIVEALSEDVNVVVGRSLNKELSK